MLKLWSSKQDIKKPMLSINSDHISEFFRYEEFIPFLKESFKDKSITTPQRNHYALPGKNTSLIMPAWNNNYYGIKQILISPDNPKSGLPTIRGDYNLYNIENGEHLAKIDAPGLTAIRTATTSVLASTYITKDSKSLLIIGAGVIAEELIAAYSSVYDLSKIKVWNRTQEKAQLLVKKYENIFPISMCSDLKEEVNVVDLISCATLATQPIIKGKWLESNPHLDLIGSYSPLMREVDDDVISKADIYIDHEGAKTESGDLSIPLESRIISENDIKATLFQLCKGEYIPQHRNNLTLFKSVGHALEDLAGAIYLYQKMSRNV